MEKTIFRIEKMDCPAEEQMVKMKLQPLGGIRALNFDIPNRKLEVYHDGKAELILSSLESLDLNTKLISSEKTDDSFSSLNGKSERKLLWTVLIINFSFFGVEIIAGFLAKSMGLVADSLDMLADAIVYSLALFAVGGAVATKKKVARFAGYFQIVLALIGFTEVIRRFVGVEKMPDFQTMIIVSLLALIANVFCLYLLQKGKSKEAHMQASMIFTSNDVIINTGVIIAGLLVNWLNSSYPDLIIGAIVFVIVTRGARNILKLSN